MLEVSTTYDSTQNNNFMSKIAFSPEISLLSDCQNYNINDLQDAKEALSNFHCSRTIWISNLEDFQVIQYLFYFIECEFNAYHEKTIIKV